MRSKDTNLTETSPVFPNLNIHLGNEIIKNIYLDYFNAFHQSYSTN